MGAAVLARRRAVFAVVKRVRFVVLAVLVVPIASLIPVGNRGVRPIVVVAPRVSDTVVIYAAVGLLLVFPFLLPGVICRWLRGRRLRPSSLSDNDVRNTTSLYSIYSPHISITVLHRDYWRGGLAQGFVTCKGRKKEGRGDQREGDWVGSAYRTDLRYARASESSSQSRSLSQEGTVVVASSNEPKAPRCPYVWSMPELLDFPTRDDA